MGEAHAPSVVCRGWQTIGVLRDTGLFDAMRLTPAGPPQGGVRAVTRRSAKAQKVLLAALRCAFRAPRKPRVTVLGHPSNACVRPMEGSTPARNAILNSRPRRHTSCGKRLTSAHTLRRVFLFVPTAPAVQIFIPTMGAFDRSQLIIEIRQRLAARCFGLNRNHESARSVLTQPPYVDLARHHLLPRPHIDVAQRR
jgi:hypothetical protein